MVLIAGCADMPRAVHYAAIATEVVAEGSLACDAMSTHTALQTDIGSHEDNPLMGLHPDTGMEVGYFGGIGAGVAGANAAFAIGGEHATAKHQLAGDVWRIVLNVIVTGVEVDASMNNVTRGAGFCGLRGTPSRLEGP